jgi:imidazoleglycerol phosphate synthase glutamine amidotransferase subunit HisH
VPNNQRILFNAAQVIVSTLQQQGYDPALSNEAYEILHHVDHLLPGQQRFAQLMEQLTQLQPQLQPQPQAQPQPAPDGDAAEAA